MFLFTKEETENEWITWEYIFIIFFINNNSTIVFWNLHLMVVDPGIFNLKLLFNLQVASKKKPVNSERRETSVENWWWTTRLNNSGGMFTHFVNPYVGSSLKSTLTWRSKVVNCLAIWKEQNKIRLWSSNNL